MSGNTNTVRKTARRQAVVDEIVAASWLLVREHGLVGLSMRDLGDQVGMRAQSIYSYFDSKHAIYDAMFHQGYLAFAEHMEASVGGHHALNDPTQIAKSTAHAFVDFCMSDPVRHQLLFQRTIPGFEPSAESYAVALEVLDRLSLQLVDVGIVDNAGVDLWTAMLTGLANQQISNDPGGDRWVRLVDRAVEVLLTESTKTSSISNTSSEA